jgi:hypothetical protein
VFKALLSLFVLTSSVAGAKITTPTIEPQAPAFDCGQLLVPMPELPEFRRVRDIDVLNFVAGIQYMRPGEQNAAILDFYLGSEKTIAVATAVGLIRGLKPEGPMPTHAQFFRHVSRDYAEAAILHSIFELHGEAFTARDTLFLLDLVQNPQLKEKLRAKYAKNIPSRD